MTSARTRQRMVERLREQGIQDEVVLAAMQAVPRHIFVDEALASRAYEDSPLPIGFGQTISQPWVVARMCELMRQGKNLGAVLEVGTGCGYQTAVLAQFCKEVYSVERIGALLAKARRNLLSLRASNVRLKHADGAARLPEDLQFEGIIVAAGSTLVPMALTEQLIDGGRLVLPLTLPRAQGGEQRLVVVEKTADDLHETVHEAVRFVPLLTGMA
ncbi:MAG: protein-L-isoaspartate(D-aspartate) O-methyltransferase [Betaproteobacteria bacterium]|nr:protein-L-isoaspartate(D-aspartate) O-methyltransferase [Betaproteobacteria bacterium]